MDVGFYFEKNICKEYLLSVSICPGGLETVSPRTRQMSILDLACGCTDIPIFKQRNFKLQKHHHYYYFTLERYFVFIYP